MSKDFVFGVHSVTPYDLANGLPLSLKPFDVLGTFSASLTQEQIELFGGSNFDAFDVESGARTFDGSFLLRNVPNALVEIATGSKPTENVAEASGSVTSLRNVLNVSLQDAVTGIASIGLTSSSEIDIPFASYTVEAVSPTTVDVFVHSDVDFAQGADKTFQAGTHKINASPLTITMGGVTVIPDFGLEFTGGSGTIAMVTDDTAVFESRPANLSSRIVTIGSPLAKPKKIGLIAYAQRKSDGVMHKINMFKTLAGGLPLTLTEKAYYEGEITFKAQRAINLFNGNEGLYELETVESQGLC